MRALREVIGGEQRFFCTFPELDHYGNRPAEAYLGPLADPSQGRSISWPQAPGGRIFAYLRPHMPTLRQILEGLAASDAGVIACIPGASNDLRTHFASARFLICTDPVRFDEVLAQADLCVSYASAGTVTAGLLRGVPQAMIPLHIESQLTARRVESAGLGRTVKTCAGATEVTRLLQDLSTDREMRRRAAEFAWRHRDANPGSAADRVVEAVESLHRSAAAPAVCAEVAHAAAPSAAGCAA